MTRVAAIGLDAMEVEAVEAFIKEGRLPHLAALKKRSAFCKLDNVVAYRSELPWTLFLSGLDPESNEYWSTVEFDPETYRVSTMGAHKAKPFYSLGKGRKVIAFDVPHSVPDDDIDGPQVMAWGAHSAQFPRASRPYGLLDSIDEQFGTHPGYNNDYEGAWYVPEFVDKMTEAQIVGARRRVDIVEWLQDQHPDWEFLITVMSEAHSSGHHLWHGVDADHPLAGLPQAAHARDQLIRVYETIDEQVGRLVESVGEDTHVVVFALHGMQNNANDAPSTVLLPELLHRHHFGSSMQGFPSHRLWKMRGMPVHVPSGRYPWETLMRRRFGQGLFGRTRRAATAMLPESAIEWPLRARRKLKGLPKPRPPWEFRDQFPPETTLSVDEIAAQRGSLDWQPPMWYQDYWSQMKWFVVPTFSDAHVRVNLRGREKHGIVDPADYHKTLDEFEALISQCINPRTGRPAVDEVIRMRGDDPLGPVGPSADVVVMWTEPAEAIWHPTLGMIGPVPFNRTGEHSSNGFAMLAGPGIEPTELGRHDAYDLTRTLMAMLQPHTDRVVLGSNLLTASEPVPG